ncbi:CIC11C00000001916 [Sungouiella intermedia]|uniref:CIC11C00000001916 n=1 Tax=Sungouiella intermedia TaxID=45354 RepID=A0A1L0DAT7_9ASCO|nr:CIC11C00000001916 [[Candida] intermedia]
MTSLISRPILDLSVSYDCDSTISLYNVWKVTNHECLACKQAPLLRLNNRLWRLLNEKLLRCLLRKIDHSYLDLNNAPLHAESAGLPTLRLLHHHHELDGDLPEKIASDITSGRRSSLASDHLSDHKLDQKLDHRLDHLHPASDHLLKSELIVPSPPSQSHVPAARPSLFLNSTAGAHGSRLTLGNSADDEDRSFDSADDTSDISEVDEYEYSDDDDVLYESSEESNCNHRIKQSRFVDHESDLASPLNKVLNLCNLSNGSNASNLHHLSPVLSKAAKVPPLDVSPHNTLYSDQQNDPKVELKNIFYIAHTPSPPERNGEDKNVKRQDSLFGHGLSTKVSNHLSSVSSTDISDDEYDLDAEDADVVSPIVKTSRASKSTTEDNDSEWMSVSSDGEQVTDSPRTQPLSFSKIIPARTALETVPDNASLTDVTRKASPVLNKPRSLLSGLFLNEMAQSTTGSPTSAKSFSHPTNTLPKPVLKRSSTTGVITVDKNMRARDQVKGLRTSIIFSKRYASFTDISRRMGLYRSPVLFVEEEEAPGETKLDTVNKSDSESLLAKQTSSVELSKFIATATPANPSINVSASGPIASVNKSPTYDGTEGALSSSLSKYSSLYPSAGSSFKNILSKSSLNISSYFGLNKLSKLKSLNHIAKSETFKSPPRQSEPLPSLFAGYLSQQNSQEAFDNLESFSKSSSKVIKVAPNPIKDFEPSVEISESLKDSLMIDHKLGKIPLPERVIRDDELFGNDRTYVDDSNDYYSKGW